MKAYLIRRAMASLLVLLLSSIAVFALMSVVPGDTVTARFGLTVGGEQQAAYRSALGLDDPAPVRYARWLGEIARGDLGTSLSSREPVRNLLADRLPATLQLGFMSLFVSIGVGIPAGIFAATRRNSWIDVAATTFTTAGASLPIFLSGLVLILVFAIQLHWLPTSGFIPFTEDPIENLRRMIMPPVALGLAGAALIMRTTRASTLEVLQRDFIRTARSKGLRSRTVLLRHALRNALIPILTVTGFELGGLLGGAVITEQVFDIPGMGRLLLDAIQRDRDYTLVQTLTFMGVAFVVGVNFLVDVGYALVDPRIRYT